MWAMVHKLGSPKIFYRLAGRLLPWLWGLFAILCGYGVIAGLFFAPADYQQGDAYRIIFIHVPSSALSLLVFMWMAVSASIYLIWHIKLADIVAKVSAPIGAWFAFLALVTGSLWGKPMWGTWWIWDARLTSELILLFLYLGVIALRNARIGIEAGARASAILTLVGVVDLPIIHYSVNWWNTLHQKSTILQFAKPTMAPSMFYPLFAMLGAFFVYYLAVMFVRARGEILVREERSGWVRNVVDSVEKGDSL